MPIVRLVNYPSGDPVFDQLFEETQPDWVVKDAEIQIAKDQAFIKMLSTLIEIRSQSDNDGSVLTNNPLLEEIYNLACKAINVAEESIK